jgi:hypothetical protein
VSFVSYAQNFEDVVLWPALKHVQNDFYIDIGAQHPVVNFISKAFYENIDVEGLEEKELRGWDSKILRFWIMVIDAVDPHLSENDYESWGFILKAADYRFVYFDGFNHFYVAKEHYKLAEIFSAPPDAFDDVELSGLASSELCHWLIASLQASKKMVTVQSVKFTTELNAIKEHNIQLQAYTKCLQNASDEANFKINELNQPLHDRKAITDRPDQVQKSTYIRKFWLITWLLRRLMRTTRIMEWGDSHA